MFHIAYAQNAEDIVLLRGFHDTECGFYVDVGAGHPTAGSVTKNLYLKGWHGINIEPHPTIHKLLAKERERDINLNIAIAKESGRTNLNILTDNWGMSTLSESIALRHIKSGWDIQKSEVVTEPLEKILKEYASPSFEVLKIDVEGFEKAVLESFDIAKWKPQVMVIEATQPGTQIPSHKSWESIVIKAGYKMVLFDGLNRFYVRSDLKKLRNIIGVPANIFDKYIPNRWWEMLSPAVRKKLLC